MTVPELPILMSAVSSVIMAGVAWYVQVVHYPHHAKLAQGYHSLVLAVIIRTTWLKTILWTGRAGIAITLLGLLA